jgi:hypothetical protein
MTNLVVNIKLIDDASKLLYYLGNFDQWHVWTKVAHRKTNFMRINFEYNNLMRCKRKNLHFLLNINNPFFFTIFFSNLLLLTLHQLQLLYVEFLSLPPIIFKKFEYRFLLSFPQVIVPIIMRISQGHWNFFEPVDVGLIDLVFFTSNDLMSNP